MTHTLEEGAAAAAVIGPDGGALEAFDGNGTRYTLSIPAGALMYPERIVMTPIAAVAGEADGDAFLAGVSLRPDGLQFLELVTLEIQGPMLAAGAVAIAADAGGQDLHQTLSVLTDDKLTISLTHFSDYGGAETQMAAALQAFVPLALGARAEYIIATGTDPQIMAELQRLFQLLLDGAGNISGYAEWKGWTAEILSIHTRMRQLAEERS